MWKAKKKDLTEEEAIELAKKELAPFWLGSPPLMIGLKQGHRAIVVPLQSDFIQKSWVMLFVDWTHFECELALFYLKQWHWRYQVHGLKMLLIAQPTYPYLKNRVYLQKFEKNKEFPMVIDLEGRIAAAFDVKQMPHVVLFNEGRVDLSTQKSGELGSRFFTQIEEVIQSFLRSKDVGLPLLPVFEPSSSFLFSQDALKIELGALRQTENLFLPQGFDVGEGLKKNRSVDFKNPYSKKMGVGQVFLQGKWSQNDDRIYTLDSEASLIFTCPSSRFSVVAQSLKEFELGVISVEVNGVPVFESMMGEDLSADDSGRSLLRLGAPKLYHVLIQLDPKQMSEVTLRFPAAHAVGVALYGLRLGNPWVA